MSHVTVSTEFRFKKHFSFNLSPKTLKNDCSQENCIYSQHVLHLHFYKHDLNKKSSSYLYYLRPINAFSLFFVCKKTVHTDIMCNFASKWIQLVCRTELFHYQPTLISVCKIDLILPHVQKNQLFIRAQYKTSYRKCHI